MPSHRIPRVEELIREELAQMIQRDVKDPRIPVVFNLTRVNVSPDLQNARVYFSQMPDDADSISETIEGLERASGFMRGELGRRIRLRFVPQLSFYFDDSEQKLRRVEELLREARPPEED